MVIVEGEMHSFFFFLICLLTYIRVMYMYHANYYCSTQHVRSEWLPNVVSLVKRIDELLVNFVHVHPFRTSILFRAAAKVIAHW